MVKDLLRTSLFACSLVLICCLMRTTSSEARQKKTVSSEASRKRIASDESPKKRKASNEAFENKKEPINYGRPVIWQDPGRIEDLDFVGGAGGRDRAPKPPFTFVEENLSGSNPKVRVTDAKGVRWSVKFGPEVSSEIFATRLAWAAGYFVEPAYYVATGRIDRLGKLKRAKKYIKGDGRFTNARFELQRDKRVKSLEGKQSWSWVRNPFVGSKELSGLKVVVMLVSNWDNKDARDAKRGSNTEIHQYPRSSSTEDHYLISDWGGSMGKWGGYFTREKWDWKGYRKQTPDFIKGLRNCTFSWGFSGQHTKDFTDGIRISHVRWVMEYLGRIRDEQLRDGLAASGASPKEVDSFAQALRQRINQIDDYLNVGARVGAAHTRPRRCVSASIK